MAPADKDPVLRCGLSFVARDYLASEEDRSAGSGIGGRLCHRTEVVLETGTGAGRVEIMSLDLIADTHRTANVGWNSTRRRRCSSWGCVAQGCWGA